MTIATRLVRCLACFLALAAAAAPADAQTFPSKTIRIIASTPPGGNIDLLSRLLAQQLQAALGQPVIVENKPGAAGNIAAEFVAKAPADGYTLLVTASSHATNVNLYAKLPYDPVKDFAPVSLLTTNFFVVAVPAASPVNSFAELLTLAKSKPGGLNYGSSGSGQGNHLGMELLKSMAGFDATHIPFSGTGPVTTALLSNQVDVAIQTPPGVMPQLKTGKLKVLAVTSKSRVPLLPGTPTVAEFVPGYELTGWIGLLAPAGTPKEVIAILHREVVKALKQPDVVVKLGAVSADPVASTPEEFAAFLQTEINTWGKVIKQSGAKAE